MWFWVKHLSLAFILIAAAIYFLFGSGPVMDMKDTKNAAAQGLSRFYAALRNQVNDKNNERDKYVLKLPTPETSLDVALLNAKKSSSLHHQTGLVTYNLAALKMAIL